MTAGEDVLGAPAPPGSSLPHALIGRETEYAAAVDHVLGRGAGAGGLLIIGEAGIGKSALWAAAVAAATDSGGRVLSALPAETERQLPYAVLGDLLDEPLSAHAAQLSTPRRRALEIALQRREPGPAPLDQARVARAVADLIGAAAGDGLVIALDDVQWVDPASAAALAFALRRLGTAPVRVLATARAPWSGSAPVGWPVEDAATIDLGGLSLGATQRLVASRVRRLGHAESRWVHEEAAGNPLHSLELARAIRPGTGGVPQVDPGLQISDLVVRRLGALDPAAADLLLATALARRPTVDLLERAHGRPVLADLATLVAAELVYVDGERVRFRHPLYAAACAQAAGTAARAVAHRRLAAVTSDGEDAVRHRALATDGPDGTVAADLDEAALRARRRAAPQAAVELASLAAAATPPDDAEGRALRVATTARYLVDAGATAEAERMLTAALAEASDRRVRHRLRMALTEVTYETRGVEVTRALTELACREAGQDPVLLAEAKVVRCSRTQLPVPERRRLVDDALLLLRGVAEPDPALLLRALRESALCSFYLGDGLPRDLLDEAAALEPRLALPPTVAWRTRTVRGECAKYVDAFTEAEELLVEAGADAEREGDIASVAEIAGHRSELALWLGRWTEAGELAAEAVENAQHTELGGRIAMASCYAGMIAAHRGEAAVARAALDDALTASERADDDWVRLQTLGVLGFLAWSQDRVDEADGALSAADEIAERELLCEPRQWRHLPDRVEVLLARGELDLAADRADRLRRWAERADRAGAGSWATAMALRTDGVLAEARGDRDAALALHQDAVAAYRTLPLPFELARARLTLGATQRRAGRRRAARESVSAALQTFRDLGAGLWVARAEHELGRVGGREAGPDELTSAEQAVARLVAAGASNREVAAALSISPRTVEVHLGRIYRKLGVRGRSQLAASYS